MKNIAITDQQRRSFDEDGFVRIEEFATTEELQIFSSECKRLLTEQIGADEGNQFDLAGASTDLAHATLPQIMKPSQYAPVLADLDYRKRAQAIAEELLCGQVELTNEHMIIKPAGHGGETPWHQDQAYHSPALVYRNVNVWLALEEATPENGCMQYVPGSHKLDVLPHHPIGGNPDAHGLEVDEPEQFVSRAVACPVPSGGVVIHRSYMLHYAGPNRTDQPRPAYVLVFGCQPQTRDMPLEFPWLSTHHDGSKG